jgi:hypothetical protein
MGKTLALAVVAALGLGSLCTTGSAAATPVRSPDALPIAAASADLADQVVLVCRTRRVCGPMGHCRRERIDLLPKIPLCASLLSKLHHPIFDFG